MRKQNPSYVYVWKFHGESKPSKVVSIRAEEVNLSAAPITYGNRLLIQACVKFETMQVRIYHTTSVSRYRLNLDFNRAWRCTQNGANALQVTVFQSLLSSTSCSRSACGMIRPGSSAASFSRDWKASIRLLSDIFAVFFFVVMESLRHIVIRAASY